MKKMQNKIFLKNLEETRKWATEFALALVGRDMQVGCVSTKHTLGAFCRNASHQIRALPITIALRGDLGMGKSEIARAIIQTLCGADTVVPSPTFTLVQQYECSKFNVQSSIEYCTLNIAHFDLYRITDPSELEEIGLSHAIANDITLIEWPEIAADFLPPDTIHIYITEKDDGREIECRV
jgi:tRNA threonylcarbamoyl adenosine modification protein YjeE